MASPLKSLNASRALACLDYYRLREQPFGVSLSPGSLYPSPTHCEALASLICGIENNVGFQALISEPGMGKTTLLTSLLDKYNDASRTALLFNAPSCSRDLLRQLLVELDTPTQPDDEPSLYEAFRQVLVREAVAERRVLIVLDEAHNFEDAALEAVRLLSNFETVHAKLLHIILSGQPGLAENLARPRMKQLWQRITIFSRLVPLNAEETERYIHHRLAIAGKTHECVFSPAAVAQIARASGGIPREINRICFNCLLLGCATSQPVIDIPIVQEVCADLHVTAPVAFQVPVSPVPPVPSPVGAATPPPLEVSTQREQPVRLGAPDSSGAVQEFGAGRQRTALPRPAPSRSTPYVTPSQQRGEAPIPAPAPVAAPARTQRREARFAPGRTASALQAQGRVPAIATVNGIGNARTRQLSLLTASLLAVIVIAFVFLFGRGLYSRKLLTTDMPATPKTVAPQSEAAAMPSEAAEQSDDITASIPAAKPVRTTAAARRTTAPVSTTEPTPESTTDAPSELPSTATVTEPMWIPAKQGAPHATVDGASGEAPPPVVAESPAAAGASATMLTGVLDASPSLPKLTEDKIQKPRVLKQVQPSYPAAARDLRLGGKVEVAATVSKNGSVSNVQAIAGPPLLASAAVSAVRQWQFAPALLNGQPVEMQERITITFVLPH